MNSITVGHKSIWNSEPIFIIAEAGVNHNGELSKAIDMIKVAKDCGADCIKFQTFKAEEVVDKLAPRLIHQSSSESQFNMLKRLELRYRDFMVLKNIAEDYGLIFMSTPYSFNDIDFLNGMGVKAFKVASCCITEYPFLKRIAKTGKPVFLSTGMSTMDDVFDAVAVIKAENTNIVIMHCVSCYPTSPEDCNMRTISAMQNLFDFPLGYSDHTIDECSAILSVALKVRVIEKHFTLDKSLEGPDHKFSLNPQELKSYISKIRQAEKSLGMGGKTISPKEKENKNIMRRSIIAIRNISVGETITESGISFIRPYNGVSVNDILDKKSLVSIPKNTFITKDMIDDR